MFFNTAIVQMSEAMSHLMFTLAQHADVQERMFVSSADRRLYEPGRWLRKYRFASAAEHARSMPNRGPCLLARRAHEPLPYERALLAWMRLRDRWENVFRSIAQLVPGVIMVLEARRLRLCERYFAANARLES